jgi:SEC-C motif-containing protein
MRSRFSAFALGLDDYLLSSWHPANRPPTIELEPGRVWRKLQIVDTADGGPDDETGIVEFRASSRDAAGAAGVLHECSRFARFDGRWVYLDGDVLD